MKNLFKFLMTGLTVVSLVFYISCSSDDDGGGGEDLNPNSFCTGELCSQAGNVGEVATAECIDDYNDCVALNEGTNEECKVFALNACNL